jgi:pimeloyl-ACP methyl ester carboxylesterase
VNVSSRIGSWLSVVAAAVAVAAGTDHAALADRRAVSADGVAIAYSAGGSGEPALVFVHGGFADRTFWRHQLAAFAGSHRIVALDLAGHGESGRNRQEWTMEAFGADVRAVVEAERLERAVLIGNSLGFPVVLAAARQLPGRVVGLVAVDTLHDLSRQGDPEQMRTLATRARQDFPAVCAEMVGVLFHPDAGTGVRAEVEERMCRFPAPIAAAIWEQLATYDLRAAFSGIALPVRAINGDLYPTAIEANREVVPGLVVTIVEHTGHYPMLERPEEFDRLLREALAGLAGR